jgi:MFS family permease
MATSAKGSGFWYHGWSVVAVCVLSQVAANGLTYNSFSLFLRDWSTEFATPVSRLQLPIAAMVTVAALISPLVGALADKYPARRLFGWGLFGMALFYVAISMATSTTQVIALYALLAPLALCLSTAVTANALISRWFVRRLGLALGLSAFGIGMAGVILPPIIGTLLPSVGWRMIWRGGGAVVALLVLPMVVLVIRNQPTEAEGEYYLGSDGKSRTHHGHGGGGSSGLNWREVASRRNFWLLVGIFLPLLSCHGGVAQNLAPLAASHGLAPRAGGVLLSVLSFTTVVSTLVTGLLSDRFGNRLPFMGLAAIVIAGVTVLAFGSSLSMLAFGSALVGLGGGWATLLAAAIATEFGAEGVGRAFGLCMLFLPFSGIAPFSVARAQEATGSYAPGLLGLGAVALISGILSLLLRERRGDTAGPTESHRSNPSAVPSTH